MKKIFVIVVCICLVGGYFYVRNQDEKIDVPMDTSRLKNIDCSYFANRGKEVLEQFDPASFEVLYCDLLFSYHNDLIRVYSKDKNKVYFNDRLIVGADPKTFTLLENQYGGCYYAKDKSRFYKDDKPINFSVDLETFSCVDTEISDNTFLDGIQYTRDKKQVFYLDKPIPNADPQTFRVLDVDYALDKNQVYYQNQIIKGANSKEFEALPHPQHMGSNAFLRHFVDYGRDKNTVYFKNTKLLGADPETFELLTDPNVGKDQYVKDKKSVYISGERLVNADPKTFEVFDEHASLFYKNLYAKDSKHVYFGNQLVNEAQAQFFQSISVDRRAYGYFKDQKQVYYDGEVLKNVDVATFAPVVNECFYENRYFKDQNHIYYEGSLTPFDSKTFVVLGNGYVKDSRLVYYKDHGQGTRQPWLPVMGADATSFQLRDSASISSCFGPSGEKEDAKDKFFLYAKGKKYEKK